MTAIVAFWRSIGQHLQKLVIAAQHNHLHLYSEGEQSRLSPYGKHHGYLVSRLYIHSIKKSRLVFNTICLQRKTQLANKYITEVRVEQSNPHRGGTLPDGAYRHILPKRVMLRNQSSEILIIKPTLMGYTLRSISSKTGSAAICANTEK